jgi:restriction system protein
MPRCWVIAPFESENRETFDKVWQFDVGNNLISIGWSQVGDVSKMSAEELSNAVASTYPDKPLATKALYRNMLWNFYHEIAPGDFVIARRGRKILAAVGQVIQSAAYSPGKSPATDHPNFLEVAWQAQPRDKIFPSLVFPMQTLIGISEVQYKSLLEGSGIAPAVSEPAEATDESAFVLEKYLEEFIVTNFGMIFKGKLRIYEDAEAHGQQYLTDIGPIDILAVEPDSGSFVVIELKRGRPSDPVVGQILRYMGWVKKNLCKNSQGVKGLVICSGDPDPKLSYALEMTNNIDVRYYKVSFTLS